MQNALPKPFPKGQDMVLGNPASIKASFGYDRIPDYDLARGLAVLMMLFINFGAVFQDPGVGTCLVQGIADLMERRAAVILVMVSGAGLSLMAGYSNYHKIGGQLSGDLKKRLFNRSCFLFVLGYLLSLVWTGDILHFYGIFIFAGIYFLNKNNKILFLAVMVCWLLNHFQQIDAVGVYLEEPGNVFITPLKDILFTGYFPIFPWMIFFLAGMFVGKMPLHNPAIQAVILILGLLLVIPEGIFTGGSLGFRAQYELYFSPVISGVSDSLPFSVLSGIGTGLLGVLSGTLLSNFNMFRKNNLLTLLGKTSLTLYVLHVFFICAVLLLSDLNNFYPSPLPVMGLFLISYLFFIWFWLKRYPRGPLEMFMRLFDPATKSTHRGTKTKRVRSMKKAILNKSDFLLVVGTTPDYIHWIRTKYPGRALFITDPVTRRTATEPVPPAKEEILVGLNHKKEVIGALFDHLKEYGQTIAGVTCFDCEYLELAAVIAAELNLDYPSAKAIRNCRDKYISKRIWQEYKIPCPRTAPVDSQEDALCFFNQCDNGIVLKPFYGSGSELVFHCRTEHECQKSFNILEKELKNRHSNPIFHKRSSQNHLMLAEAFISGPEYSCDMVVNEDRVSIIRLTKKIKPVTQLFGTASGYILPANFPLDAKPAGLEKILLKSAHALGVRRGICMVDFILQDRTVMLIELTPRPGGDCLPLLMQEALNFDILGLALDFAENKPIMVPEYDAVPTHVGLRLHAHKCGVFKGVGTEALDHENRVKKIDIIRAPGHRITMPPEDYDSWLIGHMIIKPHSDRNLEAQSLLMAKRLELIIE